MIGTLIYKGVKLQREGGDVGLCHFFFMFLHHPNNRFEYISALILPLFNSRVPHPKIILRIKTIMEENFRPLQAPKLRL